MRSQVSQQSGKDGASWWGPKRCRRLGGSAAATGLWGWFSEEASGLGSSKEWLTRKCVGRPAVGVCGRSFSRPADRRVRRRDVRSRHHPNPHVRHRFGQRPRSRLSSGGLRQRPAGPSRLRGATSWGAAACPACKDLGVTQSRSQAADSTGMLRPGLQGARGDERSRGRRTLRSIVAASALRVDSQLRPGGIIQVVALLRPGAPGHWPAGFRRPRFRRPQH